MDLGSQNNHQKTPVAGATKAPTPGSGTNFGIDPENVITKVAEKIEHSTNILIALSKDPNVDEISAAIALAFILDQQKKHVTAIYSGQTPNALEFLRPEKTFQKDTSSLQDFIIALNKSKADHLIYQVEGDYVKILITPYKGQIKKEDLEYSYSDYNVDLVIVFNVNAGSEIDSALSEYGRIMHDATAINITSNVPGHFADLEWSDPSKSSVCEMVYDLLNELDIDQIPQEVATALLTGILSATDRFLNNRTKPTTMAVASKLMEAGADQQLISSNIIKPEAPAPEQIQTSAPASVETSVSNPASTETPTSSSTPTEGSMSTPITPTTSTALPNQEPFAEPNTALSNNEAQQATTATQLESLTPEQELERMFEQNQNQQSSQNVAIQNPVSQGQINQSPTSQDLANPSLGVGSAMTAATSVMDDLARLTDNMLNSQTSTESAVQASSEPAIQASNASVAQAPITPVSQNPITPATQIPTTTAVQTPLESVSQVPIESMTQPQPAYAPSAQSAYEPQSSNEAQPSYVAQSPYEARPAQPVYEPQSQPAFQPQIQSAPGSAFEPLPAQSVIDSVPSQPVIPKFRPSGPNPEIYGHTIAEPVSESTEDMSRLMDEALAEPSPIQNPIGYQSLIDQSGYINQSLAQNHTQVPNYPLAVGQQPVSNLPQGQNLATLSAPAIPQLPQNQAYPNPEYTNVVPQYQTPMMPVLPENPTQPAPQSAQPVPQSISQPIAQATAQPAPQFVSQPAPQSVQTAAQPISQPIMPSVAPIQSAPQPVPQSTPQSMSQPSQQDASQTVLQSAPQSTTPIIPTAPSAPMGEYIQATPPATSTPIPDFLQPESFLPPAPAPVIFDQTMPPVMPPAPQTAPQPVQNTPQSAPSAPSFQSNQAPQSAPTPQPVPTTQPAPAPQPAPQTPDTSTNPVKADPSAFHIPGSY